MESDALAETVMIPETVVPVVGAVREVMGAVISADNCVVTLTLVDCAELFPAASVADTV